MRRQCKVCHDDPGQGTPHSSRVEGRPGRNVPCYINKQTNNQPPTCRPAWCTADSPGPKRQPPARGKIEWLPGHFVVSGAVDFCICIWLYLWWYIVGSAAHCPVHLIGFPSEFGGQAEVCDLHLRMYTCKNQIQIIKQWQNSIQQTFVWTWPVWQLCTLTDQTETNG